MSLYERQTPFYLERGGPMGPRTKRIIFYTVAAVALGAFFLVARATRFQLIELVS